jgi:tetratricopeptide (TPR) repeat protein
MKIRLTLFTLVCLTHSICAQTPKLDSLSAAFKSAKHDTTKARIILYITDEIFFNNIDTVIPLNNRIIGLANKNKSKKLELKFLEFKAEALNNIGGVYATKGDIKSGLLYFHKSLAYRRKSGNKKAIAQSLNNIGSIYDNTGQSEKAMKVYNESFNLYKSCKDENGMAMTLNNMAYHYNNIGDLKMCIKIYNKCLKYQEKNKDLRGQAYSLNNIASIYKTQGQIEKSLEYFRKSYEIHKSMNNKAGMGVTLNNIGNNYYLGGQLDSARKYYTKSLEYRKEINEKSGIAQSIANLGTLFQKERKYNEAIHNYKQAMNLQREINDKRAYASGSSNLAVTYICLKEYALAQKYLDTAFQYSKELGNVLLSRNVEKVKAQADSATGNFSGAFEHYKKFIILRDSLNNVETRKASLTSQLNYEFEKKEAILKEQQLKERAIAKSNSLIQQIIIWAVVIGLLIVIIFAVSIKKTLKTTHLQKLMIEEKQREILDSIHYAKRIQNSLLPSNKYIEGNFTRLKSK